MSSVSCGIVGLPNSGKSTLFNVLVNEKKAKTAVTPFTTIAHNEGVLTDIKFIDIAGLVRGSHKGQGFGNAFLEKIRGVDLILHVVRAFYSNLVSHPHKIHEPGSITQVVDDNKIAAGASGEYLSLVENKFQNPVVAISAKFEESLIGLDPTEIKKRLNELKVTETGLDKIIKKTTLLLSKKSLN